MKKIILPVLALAAALTVSCNKEQGTDSPAAKASKKVTIEASIDGTKTYYANDKTFSWLAGDEISVMEELDGEVKFDVFTAAAEGRATSFNGEISEGATFGKWAVYPATLEPEVDEAGVLSFKVQHGSVQEIDPANPLKYLPLVGQKQEDGKYKFSTAMGAVKFSFTNVPANAYYFNINAKEPIYGYFTADEDGTVKSANYVGEDAEAGYSWWEIVPNEDGTLDVYVPMPVGTLTAGMEVWLEDIGVNTLFSITTAKDIEVVRNRVTELAPIALPDAEPVALDDIFGEYTTTSYGAIYGWEQWGLSIEPSDIEEADAMIPGSFIGWPIDAMYGFYDEESQILYFPAQEVYVDEENDGTWILISALLGEDEEGQTIIEDINYEDAMFLQFTQPGNFTSVGEYAPALYFAANSEDGGSGWADVYLVLTGAWAETDGASLAPTAKASKANPFFDASKIKASRTNSVKVPFKAGKTLPGKTPVKAMIDK